MEDDGIGDLFDHIEDLLDFPNEKDDDDVLGLVEPCDETGALLLPPPPVPVAADGVLGGVGEDSLQCSSKQNICDELDVVQLEWMSKFFDDSDSFSLDLPRCDAIANNAEDSNAQTKAQGHSFFRTSSPVSVLEANTVAGGGGGDSSSSFSSPSSSTTASYFSGGDNVRALPPPLSPPEPPSALAIPSRARSKRSRPATFSPRPHVAIPYLPPSSDVPHPFSAAAASDPESIGEFCPPPPPQKKKKKSPATGDEAEGDEPGSPPPVRKCMHCKIEKTPQWRAGPMGPKTLCNACGVRYKTGRLFPEYRPAASPTFVPSLHSNSHKKVVEMRIKASQKAAYDGLRPARVHSPEDKHA